jgi:PAS domain S-box-containing protein
MASEPHGTPAAPEWSGLAKLSALRPARVSVLLAVVATGALALGIPAAWVCAFAVSALLVSAVLLDRSRAAIRHLQSVARSLRASEYRQRREYEAISAGVMTLRQDGSPATANAALVAMLGFSTEVELLAIDLREQVFTAHGQLESLLARARREGEVATIELHLRRRAGAPLIAAATVRAHWDEAGGIDHFHVTLTDIGDLKFAERQRRSLERRSRRLFDSNAAGIMFGNLRRGTMDEANARMRELAGLRPSELPALLDSVLAGGRPFLGPAVRAALETDGFAPPNDTVYVRADGRPVATTVWAAMIDALQGDFAAIVVERPADHANLRPEPVAERHYESVLDALPDLVARFNREQRLTYCNAACRAWFGFPVTPTGLSLRELLGCDVLQPLDEHVDSVLSGSTVRSVIEVFQVGGRRHSLGIALSPHRRGDGTVAGIVATMRDLTALAAGGGDGDLHTSADNTYRMSAP